MSTTFTYNEVIHRFRRALDSATERYFRPDDQERLDHIQRAIAAGVQAATAGLKGAEMVPAAEIKRQITERVKEINSAYDTAAQQEASPDEQDGQQDDDDEEDEEVIRKPSKKVEETLRALRAAKRETLHTLSPRQTKIHDRIQRNYDATIQAVQDGKTILTYRQLQEILDKQLVEYLDRYGSVQQTSSEAAASSRGRHVPESSTTAAGASISFHTSRKYIRSTGIAAPISTRRVREVGRPASQRPLKIHAHEPLTAPKRHRSPDVSPTVTPVPKKRAKEVAQASPQGSRATVNVLPLPILEGLTRNEAFFRGYDYIIQSVLNETAEQAHPQFKAHFKAVRDHALGHYGLTVDDNGTATEYRNARAENGTQTEEMIQDDTASVAVDNPEEVQGLASTDATQSTTVGRDSIASQAHQTPNIAATPEEPQRPEPTVPDRSSSQNRVSIIRRFPSPDVSHTADLVSGAAVSPKGTGNVGSNAVDFDTNPKLNAAQRDEMALAVINQRLRGMMSSPTSANQSPVSHISRINMQGSNQTI